MLNLRTVVEDSYRHFTEGLDITPTVDELCTDIVNNYEGYADACDSMEKEIGFYQAVYSECIYQNYDIKEELV